LKEGHGIFEAAHTLGVVLKEIEHGLVCVVGELEALFTFRVSQSFKQAMSATYRMVWLFGVWPFGNRISYLL
jgi:hypothetical protein